VICHFFTPTGTFLGEEIFEDPGPFKCLENYVKSKLSKHLKMEMTEGNFCGVIYAYVCGRPPRVFFVGMNQFDQTLRFQRTLQQLEEHARALQVTLNMDANPNLN